jgi:hypothetical protein
MELTVEGDKQEWMDHIKRQLLMFGAEGVAHLIEGKEQWFVDGTLIDMRDS